MDRGWTIFVRCAGVSAALVLVGVCVSDFYTDFWVEHAMFTAVLSAFRPTREREIAPAG